MDFYDVEVDCMAYCYGGSPKFTVEPYGYGEWAKREDVDVLTAERDRLAAENAELKLTDQYQRALDEMHLRYNVEAELAAANATLDALREVVPEGFANNWCCKCKAYVDLEQIKDYEDTWIKCKECGSWDHEQSTEATDHFRAILYPQPAALAEEKTNGPE